MSRDEAQPAWTLAPPKRALPALWPRLFSPRPDEPLRRPYGRQLVPPFRVRLPLLGVLLILCFCYGIAWAALAPYLVVAFAAPIAVLAAVAVWALPDQPRAPERTVEALYFCAFAALILWPNYLAVALPGLPWITVERLIGTPLAVALLIALSVSKPLRRELSARLSTSGALAWLLALYVLLQAASIAFSGDKGASINRFITCQTSWTCVFLVSCVVLAKPRRAEAWAGALCAMAAMLGLLAVWEHRLNHLPWVGHIPGFLKVNDPSVQAALAGTARMGSKQYRSQGTFTTSLALSEYMALAVPFALHFIFNRYPPRIRAAGVAALILAITAAVFSQARTGLVGILLGMLIYPLAWMFLHSQKNRASLAAYAVVYLSPLIFLGGLAASFVVPALKYRIWAGGASSYSNQSRIDQWHLGIPKILSHPWGHGIGQGAQALGYFSPGGGLTIDSYVLRLLLEYGPAGLIVFYLLFAVAIYYVLKARALLGASRAQALLLPAGIALFNYALMKSVFAQEDNMPIVAMLLGLIVALRSSPATSRPPAVRQPA
jgi:hypothetical protein